MEINLIFKKFILILILVLILLFIFSKKDKFFYDVHEIYPDLDNINNIKNEIYEETKAVYLNKQWDDWPEKNLYNSKSNGNWKIFPFYAFNTWVNKNCKSCPKIYQFLKSIKGLKSALLSKLSPKMKLNPHRGWGHHSNHVIRCHYGIFIPEGCYISVSNRDRPPLFNKIKKSDMVYDNNDRKEEIRFHEKFKWLCFDDSKTHYAENMSNEDRIVLLIDIERPSNIKIGTSEVGDTKELKEIVKYYTERNIKIK